MTRIRAIRDSINDRFSVLSFGVRADQPLYEIGLATDPDLFKAENQAKRTRGNFFASSLLTSSTTSSGESVYLVPPQVVARFVGQPRLYFGLATFAENDRNRPITVRAPDSGTMYVSLAGLTERGLRRTARNGNSNGDASGYGAGKSALTWGGDAAVVNGNAANNAPRVNGNGNGATAANGATGAAPAPYSDGFSDDLWHQPTAATPAPNGAPTAPATAPSATSATPPATAQSLRYNAQRPNGYALSASQPRRAPSARELRVVSSYYQPSDWLDALRTQIGFFVSSAQWLIGVGDTTVAPHSAICQARRVDGSTEGAQHGTAFFIAPNLLLTAAHVVDGQSELIIVRGKNGAGTTSAQEPFGRFRVTAADMVKHPSYVSSSRDFDMALIRVPAANAVASPDYFELVEELTQSRPEGVVVSGYAAYSSPTGAVDQFVNDVIDADRQHMHGGYIRSLPSDETFDYDLQSLGGTSGSPVYYIENSDTPRTHMVGVHVAGASDTTNLGCRITPAKLSWIRSQAAAWGQSLSFSLGAARSLSDSDDADTASNGDADSFDCNPEPVEAEFATEQSYRRTVRALAAPTPDYPGASRFVAAHTRNYRTGRRSGAVVDRIVIHITAGGPRIDGTISWFQDGERRDPNTGRQAGPSSAHYIVGRDGEVVQMVRNADTAYHASSANSRSIGIEHNANKPYRLNRRDLPPTEPQYQASAHLVAWLCAQYGIPLDRQHIIGHIEATPGDNHDCPSSYWDWDYYMGCVRLAADALAQNSSTGATPAATSQGLRRPAHAVAQEILTPFYDPTDPSSALTCQNNAFSLAREEWFVGVENTATFPHSAICLLEMKDAAGNVTSRGTGFYIGPNRILTCAHNLHGENNVDIVPGNNGRGSEPFGRCNATSSSWRVAPRYTGAGNYDNDLAVIENVAIAAPNGRYFGFLNATPSDQMPLVVCGYSSRSDAVPQLTAAMDGFKQHLHGGYARQMVTPETIDYPILTLKRASGSPVYTLRDNGNGLEALICAVHVSGLRADEGVNTGCFITPAKLDWIEGRATTFSFDANRQRTAPVRAQELITPYYDPSNPGTALQCTNDAFSQQREEWYVGVQDTSAFPHSAICFLRMTAPDGTAYTGTGFYIGPNKILTCAHNLHGMSTVQIVPGRNGAGTTPFGEATIDSSQWRVAPRYTGDGNWDNDLAVIDNAPIAAPNGQFFRFMQATPATSMPLAVCGYSSGSNLHRNLGPVADRNKQHLHGGHAQNQATPDTIDYDILAVAGASGSPVYTVRDEGNGLEAFVCGVHVTRGPIEASGGVSVNRGCFITPTKIDWIEGRATTFSYRNTRAFSDDGVDHDVRLIPQPDKNACWAASMAMLLGFRGVRSVDPEALAREVGGSLSTSYDWNLLTSVSGRYGFVAIEQPSNASIYHSPTQWAQWLRDRGPLWVVIVGAPHAVVLAGIRGDLSNPASVEVKVLNPWDTEVAFDNDPVVFNPPNRGRAGWLPFEQFAADFGNMAEPDYGNWRVLYLPATAASTTSQSLSARGLRLAAPPRPRTLSADGATSEPIEPTRVPGTRMSTVRGSAGASRWQLDQLEGRKAPSVTIPAVNSLAPTDVVIDLGAWPAIEGEAAPLPLRVTFRSQSDGSVGDVAIVAGTPANLTYGVDVLARIDDLPDIGGVAAVKVGIDVRFSGLAQGAPAARIELKLLGDGRYERTNRWLDATQAA